MQLTEQYDWMQTITQHIYPYISALNDIILYFVIDFVHIGYVFSIFGRYSPDFVAEGSLSAAVITDTHIASYHNAPILPQVIVLM